MRASCLYLTLQPIVKDDGASEKIIAQNEAIRTIGIESHLAYISISQSRDLYIDDEFITNIVNHEQIFSETIKYLKSKQIMLLYIRYNGYAGIKFDKFLKSVYDLGVKIFMEIPTFPYDGESNFSSPKALLSNLKERFFRNRFHNYVFRIVTYSLYDIIFGIPTIKLSNAPARLLPIKKESVVKDEVNLITVANIAFWHGYDRLLRGLSTYYSKTPRLRVNVYIIGKGNIKTYNQLIELTRQLKLNDFVFFEGAKNTYELDTYFDKAHLAIGCLGCHRKGIIEVKSLKNVEYAMRGIPFVYSEENSDFDDMPYIFKVPSNDSDIDVNALLHFLSKCRLTPLEIHNSVKDLSWANQMKKVFF